MKIVIVFLVFCQIFLTGCIEQTNQVKENIWNDVAPKSSTGGKKFKPVIVYQSYYGPSKPTKKKIKKTSMDNISPFNDINSVNLLSSSMDQSLSSEYRVLTSSMLAATYKISTIAADTILAAIVNFEEENYQYALSMLGLDSIDSLKDIQPQHITIVSKKLGISEDKVSFLFQRFFRTE